MSTKTSHKKNRPFNFKLIDLVEPHPILYTRLMPGMSPFEIMKTKNTLWQQIAAEMRYSAQFCMGRWSNLRRRYQFEMERNSQLCTKTGIIRTSYWPYLNRLKFLDNTFQTCKQKKVKPTKRKTIEKPQEIEIQDNWLGNETEIPLTEEFDEQDCIVEEFDDQDCNIEEIDQNCNVEEHIDVTSIVKEAPTEVDNIVKEITEVSNIDNYHQMQVLLSGFEGESLIRIERRLMAFLCKCQIRALGEQTIDDLYV